MHSDPVPYRSLVILLAVALAAATEAQSPVSNTLVADIETAPRGTGESSDAELVGQAGGAMWLAVTTRGTGRELWITDGQPSGTVPLAELVAGPEGSEPRGLGVLPNGVVLFSAESDVAGRELFASSLASPQPRLVRNIRPTGDAAPVGGVVWQGALWFLADDGQHGFELWRSDGTAAGTVLVDDLVPGAGSPFDGTEQLVAGSGRLWVRSEASAPALWVKDSVTTPMRFVRNFAWPLPHASWLAPLAGGVVFIDRDVSSGMEPWFSDGTAANTFRLADLRVGSTGSSPGLLASDGARVWMNAQTDFFGNRQLVVTDGTVAGTSLVPGTWGLWSDSEGVLDPSGGDCLFVRQEPGSGYELWRSDGTGVGTRLAADVVPGPDGSQPHDFLLRGSSLYFTANDPAVGAELYRFDLGTGTAQRLTDLRPGVQGSGAVALGVARAGIVFRAFDGVTGNEPWRVDPTSLGVVSLGDLNPGSRTGDSAPDTFARWRDFAFFLATTEASGIEPYVTDGTAAGTWRVGDLAPGSRSSGAGPLGTTDQGVILWGVDGQGQRRLWISDGTPDAARRLPGFQADHALQVAMPGVRDGADFYFVVRDDRGTNLWRSDGSSTGTRIAAAMPADTAVQFEFVLPSGLLLGFGGSGSGGPELWVSDRTTAGTQQIREFVPGLIGGYPRGFTAIGGGAVFAAYDDLHGRELWFTDGTAAGTWLLQDLDPGTPGSSPGGLCRIGGAALFLARTATSGTELWTTDGTSAGTRLVVDLEPGPGDRRPLGLVTGNGREAWFWADVASGQPGLWITDGTASGTRLVRATRPDGQAWTRNVLTPLGDGRQVVFAQSSPEFGGEVWVSDGTSAGTRALTDSNPGRSSAEPHVGDFGVGGARVGNRLLFVADDGLTGRELHAVELGASGAWVASPYGAGCGASLDSSGAPILGQSFTFGVRTVAGSAVALLFGAAPRFDELAPGCRLHLAAPVSVAARTSDAQGLATVSLTIPNVPALVGDLLHFQAFATVAGGPLGGVAAGTNGLEIVLGR